MIAIPMALVAFFAWGVFIYNGLVGDKNRVLSAWRDIDVQLKRRHVLIPKRVDSVRHYAAYESATLTEVYELMKAPTRKGRKLLDKVDGFRDYWRSHSVGSFACVLGSTLASTVASSSTAPGSSSGSGGGGSSGGGGGGGGSGGW